MSFAILKEILLSLAFDIVRLHGKELVESFADNFVQLPQRWSDLVSAEWPHGLECSGWCFAPGKLLGVQGDEDFHHSPFAEWYRKKFLF